MVLYCFYTALRSLVALSYHVKVVVSAYYQGYWMRAPSMPCTQLLPVSGTPPPRSSATPPSIRAEIGDAGRGGGEGTPTKSTLYKLLG